MPRSDDQPTPTDVSTLPFEDAMSHLEAAVNALEDGGLGLDEALACYEQGVRLLGRCHGLLDRAERQVALLTGVEPDGTPQTAPFDSSSTSATARRRDPATDAQ